MHFKNWANILIMKNGLLSIVSNDIPSSIAKGTIGLISAFPKDKRDRALNHFHNDDQHQGTTSQEHSFQEQSTQEYSLRSTSLSMVASLKSFGFNVREITQPNPLSKKLRDNNNQDPSITPPLDQGIIDLRGCRLDNQKIINITNQIPQAYSGFTFIVDDKINPVNAKKLQAVGKLCIGDKGMVHIPNHCQQSQRVQTLEKEVRRRQKTLASLNKNTRIPVRKTLLKKPNILIAAPPGPVALSIINKVKNLAGNIYCAYRPGQAIRALESKTIDCAIFLPEQAGDPLFALTRAMKRHNRYQNIPVALIVHDTDHQYQNTPTSNILHRSQASAHIETMLYSILREGKYNQSLNIYLRQMGIPAFREKIGRDFSVKFFANHAPTICDDADQRGHNVRFLGVKISPQDHTGMTAEQISHQVAPLINRVIRAEDFFARLNTKEDRVTYGILLNNIDRRSADKIAGRVVSVVQNTMFNNKAGNPITFDVENALFRRPKGMCLEETIAGLFNTMRP